jgi:hypothetical protein
VEVAAGMKMKMKMFVNGVDAIAPRPGETHKV